MLTSKSASLRYKSVENADSEGADVLKVIPKTWTYAFSMTEGTESVAQSVDDLWWRDQAALRVQGAT